jgi:type IV pilus assembly protein PilQ
MTPMLFAQPEVEKTLRGYNAPDELITLSASIPFDRAITLINDISFKKTGRKVISLVKREVPIGVEIINVPFDKALLMIVQYAGLVYEKSESVTVIKSKVETTTTDMKPETYAPVDSREIKISAIFFEMDVNKSKERGINWQLLLSNSAGGVTGGMTTTGAATTSSGSSSTTSSTTSADFSVSGNSNFGVGNFFGQALGLFRYFESENIGEIIASPTVTVRNRALGRVQVGSDYSEKIRDFSGNIINQFFPTGTIIKVTPYIYEQDKLEYCVLDLEVEKSTATISDLVTEIKKTNAKTQVMMIDGEETAIGGLFSNEESKTRNGIPILKDLPWWVFGIRYLTGNDQITVTKKELVIVIRIDFVPRIKDRLAFPATNGKAVQNEVKSMREKMKIYQFDEQSEENEKLPAPSAK